MTTRRRFVATLAALAGHSIRTQIGVAQGFHLHRQRPKPTGSSPAFVYFAADTQDPATQGIYRAQFDPGSGQITRPELAAHTPSPSYMALGPQTLSGGRCLYVTNALPGAISSFGMHPASGALTPINQVSSSGGSPCFITVDATGRMAFAADYLGACVVTYRIGSDGGLSGPIERLDFNQPQFGHRGPAHRQATPHPHSTQLSPDNRFLLVNDLGSDDIAVFTVDPTAARLGPPALFTNSRPGSGPRHLAFHPNGRWVYSINELDSTIDQFLWTTTSSPSDPKAFLVNAGPPVSTIAPGYPQAHNGAAELIVSPGGHYLYASNRGENTLVAFSIAPADGSLKLIQRVSSGGRTPRNFALDPSGRWLVCGNQDSAAITVFRRDPASGHLIGPPQTVHLESVFMTLFT